MPSLQSELYCDAGRIYTSMTDEDILQLGMNIYFDVGTDITYEYNKRRDVIHHVSNDLLHFRRSFPIPSFIGFSFIGFAIISG